MQGKKLTFITGQGGHGLEGEYMADINVVGLNKGIIACQADDKETAERLRQFVLDRLHPEFNNWIGALMLIADGNIPEFQFDVDGHNNAVNRLRGMYRPDIPHDCVQWSMDEYAAALAEVESLHAENARLRNSNNGMEQLESNVIAWAEQRGIFANSNPMAQLVKTMEELGELAGGIAKGKPAVVKDSIGDVLVTLILQARMQGLTLAECLEAAYEEISGRQGQMIGGVFVKSGDLQPPANLVGTIDLIASAAGVADMTWDMHGIMDTAMAIDGANLSIDAGDSEGGTCD